MYSVCFICEAGVHLSAYISSMSLYVLCMLCVLKFTTLLKSMINERKRMDKLKFVVNL